MKITNPFQQFLDEFFDYWSIDITEKVLNDLLHYWSHINDRHLNAKA